MLFERQRVLLTLLDALGGLVSPTDFQKLLFLYTRKQETPGLQIEISMAGSRGHLGFTIFQGFTIC